MSQTVHLTLTAGTDQIKGESSITTLDRADTIECFSFNYGVQAGSEAFSGAASGVRNYAPISILKRVDKATPLLWKALCTNQEVEGVFKFYRPNPAGDGTTEHFYTTTIKKARVAGVDFSSPDAMIGGGSGEPPTESVSFVFNNIKQEFIDGGISHEDEFGTTG